jgi:Protein tyrosine and serine/threonine kinase
LHELMSGKRPFAGKTRFDIETQVVAGIRPDAKECEENGSREEISLMKKCWDQSDEKRPTSSEMVKELGSLDPAADGLRY